MPGTLRGGGRRRSRTRKPRRASGSRVLATTSGGNGLPDGSRPRSLQPRLARTRGHAPAVTRARLSREGKALEGMAPVGTPRPCSRHAARQWPQPGEPHGRRWDATSPTRHLVEQAVEVAIKPRGRNVRDVWQRHAETGPRLRLEWTPMVMSMEGRSLKNPVEGSSTHLESGGCEKRLRLWSTHGDGGWRFGTTRPRGTIACPPDPAHAVGEVASGLRERPYDPKPRERMIERSRERSPTKPCGKARRHVDTQLAG